MPTKEWEMSDIICSKEQPIGDKSLLKADSTTTAKTKDLPSFLKMPTPEAVEVFQAAFDNHTDSVPFDGRLVPNQWVLNERSITATVAADFDAQIESLQRENEERVKAHNEIFDALQKSEMDNEFLRGQLSDWEMTPRGAQEIIQRQADRISELEAAAITPEMRETAEKWLKDYAPGHTVDYIAMALSGRVIIHDLLGKQG